MNLYQLTEEYQELYVLLSESDNPEAEEGLHERLAAISGAIEVKAENYARIIKSLDYQAEAYKAEADRLTARRKTCENRIASMKEFLQQSMEALGIDKVKGELFTVSVQDNPQSVSIPDEDKIPDDWKIPQPAKIDKKAIAEELKSGGTVEGAELVRTRSLRIR